MKFKFRLENILRYVLLNESKKKVEIATSIRNILHLTDKQTDCEKNILNLLEKSPTQGNAYCWVPFANEKVSVDVQEIETLKGQIEEQEDDLAQRRDELSRITQKKKALETLKETRQLEFKKNQARWEQKQLEDLFRSSRRSS